MGDKSRRPDTPASVEAMFGPSRPAFGRVRRGYDPSEVTPYLDMVEQERADIGAALVLTQARIRELTAKLERHEALEDELTSSLRDARAAAEALLAAAEEQAAARVAEAEAEAARKLAEGRARLAEEEQGLVALQMAIAAEASLLSSLADASDISRAAAALVEIVDKPGGLGPFSQATSTLLEFAQLLLRTSRPAAGSTIDLRDAPGTPAPAASAEGVEHLSDGHELAALG